MSNDSNSGLASDNAKKCSIDKGAVSVEPTKEILIEKIEKDPSTDLKVIMGRQNTSFWTKPAWPDEDELEKPVTLVVRGDGIWEVRNNAIGVFCVKKSDAKLPGFPKEENHPFFTMKYGKIPYKLLEEILYFFKAICDDSKDEVYMQIFYDREKGEYFNYCPKQVVSGASVDYERDTELEEKHILVLEIHSHNTMNAYFSGIDDNDEKGDRFFGVVGELNKAVPAIKLSYVCGGKRQDLPKISNIFTEAPQESHYPEEWRGRVKKRSYAYAGGSQGSNYSCGKDLERWKEQRSESYRHQTSNTSAYKSGTETASEIEKTVEAAASRAREALDAEDRTNIDSSLNSTDFLSKPGPEVPDDQSFFRSRNTSSTSKNIRDVEDCDAQVEACVGQVEEQIIQHFILEIDMTETEMADLFNNFVAALDEKHVRALTDALVDHDHAEIVIDQLDVFEDDEEGDDAEGEHNSGDAVVESVGEQSND